MDDDSDHEDGEEANSSDTVVGPFPMHKSSCADDSGEEPVAASPPIWLEDRTCSPNGSVCAAATTTPPCKADLLDAWQMEAWHSPSSPSSPSTVCSAAQTLEKTQREVADAVHAELQVDLEAAVSRAMSGMTSWISEEIAFARKGFEENVHKATEDMRAKFVREDEARLHSSQEEIVRKLKQLEISFDDQASVLRKLQDEGLSQDRPEVFQQQSLSGSCQAGLTPAVMEARAVAEDRKWRKKLDALQAGIDKLGSESKELARRLDVQSDAHEAATRTSSLALRKIEDRWSSGEEHRRTLALNAQESQAQLEKLSRNVDALGPQLHQLAETIAAKDVDIQSTSAQLCDLAPRLASCEEKTAQSQTLLTTQMKSIRRLFSQTSDLNTSCTALDIDIRACVIAIQGGLHRDSELEVQLKAAHAERLAELKVVCGRLEQHDSDLAALPGQCMEHISVAEDGTRKSLAELDGRLTASFERMIAVSAKSAESRLEGLSHEFHEIVVGEMDRRKADTERIVQSIERQKSRSDALSGELRRVQAEHTDEIADKVTKAELEQANAAIRTWVDEARDSYNDMVNSLARWLEQAQTSTAQHSQDLQRHEEWMQQLSTWLEQVQSREQGLTQVISRVVNQSSPELLGLFEKALKVPELRGAYA